MKKICLAFMLVGLASALCACHDDNNNYCDAGYVDGCQEGMYVHCVFEEDGDRGTVNADVSFMISGVEYICNDKDQLVAKDYECRNGVLYKNDAAVENNAFCNSDDVMTTCDGSNLVRGYGICANDQLVVCSDGKAKVDACGTGLKCVDYERNDNVYAGCFNASDVGGGCGEGVTTYGVCDSDGALTFCTRKDASKGQQIRLDCPSRGQGCMLINQDFGYDCSATCSDEGGVYNEHGVCEGNTLVYCKKSNGAFAVTEWKCSEENLSCAFDNYQYSCI